ncbi:MAG: hypothetical protein ACE5H2_06425 [Terriglobia bacterium]
MTQESREKSRRREQCEHGLPLLRRADERLCALEYLNRFVAPRRIGRVARSGQHLYLVFDTGDRLECCCESCGESHGDDKGFVEEIKQLAVGRRALRFRLDSDVGTLVVWFARGDHLHLHRNALARFRPHRTAGRAPRQVRPRHTPPPETPPGSES